MNLFRQQELLDQLANILYSEAPSEYESVSCRYAYEADYMTISNQLSYVRQGKVHNAQLSPDAAFENLVITEELRELIEAHTGGVWDAFTLTLDYDGKAHCTFEYPE